MKRFFIPLAIFVALIAALAIGLNRDPREVPSPLIGKTAPTFRLTQLADSAQQFSPADLHGRVWLLNVWASWCVACRSEHPVLMDLAARHLAPVIGLDYKDVGQQAIQTLNQLGNPYVLSAFDADGRVGIDYGVYGVPETFVIDRLGVIRMKFIGPLTPEIVEQKLLPLISELNRG
jgi:cytochrome c biogenesis protein CcmG/thiol:disulfide interchange protein DsbE